jgi:hypothetical protein
MTRIADLAAVDAVPSFAHTAARVAAAVEDRAAAGRTLAGIRRLTETTPLDPVAGPRTVADHVLETGGYSFGLPVV